MTGAAGSLLSTLFGDLPLAAWPPDGAPAEDEPWASFRTARESVTAADWEGAEQAWRRVIVQPGIETRHHLQAWSFLRSIDVVPPPELAGRVLGVVVQVWVGSGHDVLAGYADGSARYLNVAGGATIVDAPAGAVPQLVAEVLGAGQSVADAIGPWTEPTLPPLPVGHTRATMLTPGGFRFGQGPDEQIRSDPFAAGLFGAATALLLEVIRLDGR